MSTRHLIDRNGNLIILGAELARGGEGTVYHVHDKPSIVAKIYLKPPDKEKSCKIIEMVDASNERLLKLAAWPLDSIHTRSGDLIGFTMQKLQGYRPLFELYSPKLRLQEFPKADWRFLIHAATNTARAFLVIHDSGHVIGDVNHGNLLVANDAMVKFIDTDSFQISIKGQRWLCEVGVNTHQPPEMQGLATYKRTVRTSSHDNFGLAILIFQLLCLARHPFSGRFFGNGDMSIEKAIAECRFAYSRKNLLTYMSPPPASLQMSSLTSHIFELFEKAFSKERIADGMRPTAKEWISALDELATELKVCPINRSHYYLNSISNCPWCDIEVKSNTILFPIIVQFTNTNQSFQTLWQQIIAIKDPGPAPSLPRCAGIAVHPSKDAQEIGKKSKLLEQRSFILSAIIGITTIIIGCVFGFGLGLLMLIGLGFWNFRYHKEKKNELRNKLVQQLSAIKTRWDEFASNWAAWVSESEFAKIRHNLYELKKQNESFSAERQERIQKLWGARKQQQLLVHLDRYRISSANIDGIGRGRSTTLQSYGIETAADIDPSRLYGINGFGHKLIQRLADWRSRCELTFVFDSTKGVSQTEIQAVDRDVLVKRRKLEQELVTGIAHLTRSGHHITERRKQLSSQASKLLYEYAQAVANAREVGVKT